MEEYRRQYRRATEQAVGDPGPYRRALCARTDLALRSVAGRAVHVGRHRGRLTGFVSCILY